MFEHLFTTYQYTDPPPIITKEYQDVKNSYDQFMSSNNFGEFEYTNPLLMDNSLIQIPEYDMSKQAADIAKQFNYSESKIKSLLFRTRDKLRIMLEKEGYQMKANDLLALK